MSSHTTDDTRDGRLFVDHYAVLGLEIAATPRDIKHRFRLLAKKHHPDTAGGDGLRFLEIYNAYQVLSDNTARNRYNTQYLGRIRRLENEARAEAAARAAAGGVGGRAAPPPPVPASELRVEIPTSRLIYPGNVATMARRGLLRKKFSGRDRRFILNIDYDVELPLYPEEFLRPLLVRVPLITRVVCSNCLGSDIHCGVCNGRGSGKRTQEIQLRLDGGLVDGQILEVQLKRLRLEALSHFKKRQLRIKITRRLRARPEIHRAAGGASA